MGIFFVYILKSAFCLAAFYLFYKMLLSKETFHRFNRLALLGIMAVSFILPGVNVQSYFQQKSANVLLDLGNMLIEPLEEIETTAVDGSFHWASLLLLVYMVGVVCFWAKHLFALGNMYRLIHTGEQTVQADGSVLILHKQDIAPFSWMHYIVIAEKDMDENGEIILRHETAHIRNRHSWDLIFADMCISLQWFNPAAWLAKRELQNVHEFEADESVIRQGIDAKRYQLLLIKKAVGTRLYSMANSFNHSSLKKRITMMIKKQSNPWARLKYLYVLPLAAIAVAAFARPEISSELDEISSAKVSDLSAILKADSPNNVVADEKEVLVKGLVMDLESDQPLPNANIVIKGTHCGTLTDQDGRFSIYVLPGQVLWVSYTGKQSYFVPVEKTMPKLITLFLKDEETKVDELVVKAHSAPQEKPVQPAPKKSVVQDGDVFMVVEQMPEYPGGMQELMTFLGKNIKYPYEAFKNDIQGRVIVQFTVKKDGSIADMSVKRSVHPLLDAEAIRVLSTMPKWKPGTQRGKAVNVRFTVPVSFRLQGPATKKDSTANHANNVMETMPEYPGGIQELMMFLGKNVRYPAEAHKNNIQGRVVVQFVVKKDGSVTDFKVLRSIDPLLDAEALRVLNTMPKWKPGTKNGEPVNTKYTVPVTFRLSGPKASENPDKEMSIRIMSNENNDAMERASAELDATRKWPVIIIDKKVAGAGYKTELGVNSKDIESVVVIKGEDVNKFITKGIPFKLSNTEMQKFKQLYDKEKNNGIIFLEMKKKK